MLWAIAVAAEQQIPLPAMINALAEDSKGRWRRCLEEAADLLDAGVALPDALEAVPGSTTPDVVLTIRVGVETGTLIESLQTAAESQRPDPGGMSPGRGGTLNYLLSLGAAVLLITWGIFALFMPRLIRTFEYFETPLPGVTRRLAAFCEFMDVWGWLFLLVIPILLFSEFIWPEVKVMIGKPGPDSRSLRVWRWTASTFAPRLHSPTILRNLAVTIHKGRPLSAVLSTLARHHHDRPIRDRLLRVYADVERGEDCWSEMQTEGLLTGGERAVLDSAARVGNLPWALHAVADGIERQYSNRVNLALEIVRPLILIAFGIVVATVAIAIFMPLLKLINDLS